MSTANKTFTLNELAKIALGATEFTNDHLNVLHSLLLILLEKLNCHNETVRLKGLPAMCIKDLLLNVNVNPNGLRYNFQFDQVNRLKKKFELLEELEGRVTTIDSKLQKRCEEIRSFNKKTVFHPANWGSYTAPTEKFCGSYGCKKEFCCLIGSIPLNFELYKRVYPKVAKRFIEFEAKIDSMRSKLKLTPQQAKQTYFGTESVRCIIFDIEAIRSSIEKYEETFHEAMTETQEMLTCKVNRQTLKALKLALEKDFTAIEKFLSGTKNMKCPSSRPLQIIDRKTCMSCGRRESKATKYFHSLISAEETHKCSCSNWLKEGSILKRLEVIESSCHLLTVASTKNIK